MLISPSATRAASIGMFFSLTLGGCIVPKIHTSDKYDAPTGVQTLSIDAKQRVVLFTKRTPTEADSPTASTTKQTAAGTGGTEKPAVTGPLQFVTCAEPSPDAMSALSSSLGASVSEPKIAASLAFAQAESAASIGLRTQSIQLLRDGMYRLCESYAAGALSAPDFNREQRRYQNLMLSLLAIEQLTGAVVPRQVGLGQGSASSSVGDKANEAASNLAKANADVASAQTALKKAQTTQDSNSKACTNNPGGESCGKAAEDKTAVENAQMALDKATLDQKTAQEALLAARASVKAEAAGAHVQFSDAPKTNAITEGTARYIAEATRTIVSTTLLASFAQEECSRIWDYLDRLPETDRRKLLEEFESKKPGPNKDKDEAVTFASELVHLAKNCQTNESQLLQTVALFTPQYGGPTTPLQVLVGPDPINLAPKDKAQFLVVGGSQPYQLSGLPPELSKEISVELTSSGSVSTLKIERSAEATKTSGKVTIYIADSTNAHVEVPVILTAKAAEPKPAEPKPAPPPKPGASIKSVTSHSNQLEVSFVPPSDVKLDKITATATNTDARKKEVLTGEAAADAKQILIKNCTDGSSYSIQIEFVPKSGGKTTLKADKPVKCSKAAPTKA